MLSLLSNEQRRSRLYAIIGVMGSFVVLASFFLLPVGVAGSGGSLSPVNGWEVLRFFLSAFTPSSLIGLLIVLLLPGCASITLVIGGRGCSGLCHATRSSCLRWPCCRAWCCSASPFSRTLRR